MQLEFPFIHLESAGGPGLGLPGPMQSWCEQFYLKPLFSKSFIQDGRVDDCIVSVGVIAPDETRKRIMMRDFVEHGPADYFKDVVVQRHHLISFDYCSFKWQIFFSILDSYSLVGRRFDIILHSSSESYLSSIRQKLKY